MPGTALTSENPKTRGEERLVELAQRGDREAISTLVERSRPRVRGFARMLCSTREDAEEATQEALIVLYRRIGTLRATAALAGWLFQIVRNECIRRAKIALRAHGPPAPAEPSAEDVVLARIELARIAETIARLEPDQRAVLVLRDVHGLSGADAAERLGVTRAAMKSRLHRARETFRMQLVEGKLGRD